ncbi:MAG: tRNA (adenosine(37)-N6)-threonylcarbamoyltransferase complex ATPase subunit type 1 TsaE [Gammaproteobacteria bacterium]|nr:MAG: tRNA (adenosine(37)-N6)-threonylcarbamoyltransferase complex ATPase subunit type 1 TsaE [Gammaproteobacteria bacterium]
MPWQNKQKDQHIENCPGDGINGSFDISELAQLDALAKQLASTIQHPAWVYLVGDLGTGKTTFAQRFIYHKGYHDRVTSPTYAIMNDYLTDSGTVIHCDLYRLCDPEELYEIGAIELAQEQAAISLIEWPSKGQGVLPKPDYTLTFLFTKRQRQLTIHCS